MPTFDERDSARKYDFLPSVRTGCLGQGVKCPTFSYFLGFVLLFPTFR